MQQHNTTKPVSFEELTKAIQVLSTQLNGLHSTHQKAAASYAALVSNMAMGNWIAPDQDIEDMALSQLEESSRLAKKSIKKLGKVDLLLVQLSKVIDRERDQ